ncbi:MAG: hypothetical protein ACK4YP_15020, partial [Myxococcota bacterium]
MRVAFALVAGLRFPFGEDAEFWGYRAAEMVSGIPFGTHPPLYPFLAAVASELVPGLGLPDAAWYVAIVAGLFMAPAMALGMTQIGGRKAGIVAGWLLAFVIGVRAIQNSGSACGTAGWSGC